MSDISKDERFINIDRALKQLESDLSKLDHRIKELERMTEEIENDVGLLYEKQEDDGK